VDEPVLTLSTTRLQVEPGGQAQLSVTVKNPGHLVESFRLDVVGLDPTWWQVHPPELPVYPGKEETALVVLTPPARAQAPDAALPFGVRAVSTLDAGRSVVEEGDLEVGRILDLQATIRPVTSRGRWFGNHQVTYTNWGNSAVHLRLSASDKDGQLGFRVTPEQVSVPVGGSARARVRVRPVKPALRGTPAHRPFQVIGESGTSIPSGTPRSAAARAGVPEPGRPVLDGALQQVPILSRSVVMLAALLALGLAGLFAMAFRTSQVKGAPIADIAPATPTGFTAAAPGATVIQLRWNPTDRAKSYEVRQVERKNPLAPLKVNFVAGGATAFADQVKKPLTRRCYVVAAVGGGGTSQPSAVKCATTRDDALAAPTNVQAVAVATGFKVSWTDNLRNDHVVLVDNAPVGQPSPAGVSDTIVAIPAGQHCVSVIAKREPKLASLPSKPPACVDSTGAGAATAPPSAAATADGQGGPGAPGAPGSGNATEPPSTSPPPGGNLGVSGWVAMFGPYSEQSFAERFRDRGLQNNLPARILQLPVAGLPPELRLGMVVVVDQLPDQAAADQVCALVTPDKDTTCRSVFASN
jgi:hypothetical protein